MRFRIEDEIFKAFPGIRVVAAYAENLKVKDPGGIRDELAGAWQHAGEEGARYGNPQSHPNIKPWGESMKAVGVSRKNFPSSIEALVRRAMKAPEPVAISPVVDFYNAVSLWNIAPAGAYDADDLAHDLTLRFSCAGDTFESMDSDESIRLPAGEVSYTDGSTVITRHFVWKQSKHALITGKSRNILFVSEILSALPHEAAEKVRGDFASGLARYFGADVRTAVLGEGTAKEFE
ncbi:MAG: phenylalanine--tRNA ligase beta subunit-related protein [Clostridiales bacterium]|nr:phenylalanine--tRNA ligase beta subunit-related protein [Clostridiales bacterium]